MAQSLFRACKNVIRNGAGSKQNIGGYDIDIEYYTQEDIDENVRKIKFGEASTCTFGDSDESKVVLVASPEITIPAGFTLTPVSPKKSLVIICNTLINNGTISMTAKAPYTLPHDWYIVSKNDGYDYDVVIPDYAHNEVISEVEGSDFDHYFYGANGNSGASRQCGSGGCGTVGYMGYLGQYGFHGISGQGYSFGGGAGSGSCQHATNDLTRTQAISKQEECSVDPVYPMRSGKWARTNPVYNNCITYGVGNPSGTILIGSNEKAQSFGCGGRLIIFCKTLINNNLISSNGSDVDNSFNPSAWAIQGGASGGGAVDLFYEVFEGENPIANGGSGAGANGWSRGGDGGNGSVTLSNGIQAPLWVMPDCFKPRRKKFSKDNWTYLFSEYVDRLNQEV